MEDRKPKVITIVGSTRFSDVQQIAMMHLSMMGHIVIPCGLYGHADEPQGAEYLTSDGDESTPEKRMLDKLHYQKIDISDAIFIVNIGGYMGSSSRRELGYAVSAGKEVMWMFPDAIPADIAEAMMAHV